MWLFSAEVLPDKEALCWQQS